MLYEVTKQTVVVKMSCNATSMSFMESAAMETYN